MSKEYGYIGKEVTQAFRDNKGIFTPQDIIELDQENKWTNFGQLELIQTQTFTTNIMPNIRIEPSFLIKGLPLGNLRACCVP